MTNGVIDGTAYYIAKQTLQGNLVVDEVILPIKDGRVAIPELGKDIPLSASGSFSLRNLPRGNEVTVIFTAPGFASFTFAHLVIGEGTHLTPVLGDQPKIDDLSYHRGTLPGTGMGPTARAAPTETDFVTVAAALLGASSFAALWYLLTITWRRG